MKEKIPLVILLFILTPMVIFAQLTIRNSAYIFVEDGALYVHEDINLQEADSKLYFRNDAQLIQGSDTARNIGLGEVSIYQSGTTHNYAYNYWCAPVGIKSALPINDDFRVSLFQDVTGLTSSVPVSFTTQDGTSSPLTIASDWIYTFESSNSYSDWVFKGETGRIEPGLGFTMKGTSGSSNNQLYDFRGKPNNGLIANQVGVNVWTLVGNPYPSALDAVDFIHDTNNVNAITGTLYFWEQDLSVMSHLLEDYVGGYATYTVNSSGTVETFTPATFDTYNSDGSINTTGAASTSGKQVRRYIPVGQGFMVEGSATTTGSVVVRNAHREYYKQSDPDSEFFRSSETNDIGFLENSPLPTLDNAVNPYGVVPQDYKRFRLNIDLDELYTRQLVQTFHDTEATVGFDYGLESKLPSFLVLNKDAFWKVGGESYLAQALPFSADLQIPLHVKLDENSTVRFRVFDIQNFDTSQGIFLYDTVDNIYVNLRTTPYELNLSQGEYPNRFIVVFAEAPLSVFDTDFEQLFVYQNNRDQQLHVENPSLESFTNICLYDMTGKMVWNIDHLDVQNEYVFETKSLSSGVYIFKMFDEYQRNFTKKIIVAN